MSSTPDPAAVDASADGVDESAHAAVAQLRENCAEPLSGQFCHRCGQSVHNPIRHAGHALEEVFESFWHLDGRIFRTLRDLPVPARVACDYLAGHRARYIAPLRLFVILSLLTFFVGQMTVDFDPDLVQFDGRDNSFATAATVAQVEQRRDRALADLADGRADSKDVPFVGMALAEAEAKVRREAAERIAELQRADRTALKPASSTPALSKPVASAAVAERGNAAPDSATSGASVDESAVAEPAVDALATKTSRDTDPSADNIADANDPTFTFSGGKPWNEKTNPLRLSWMPVFANRWFNAKIGRALTNAPRLRTDGELRKRVMLGSVPTALFVLMPVFALLLKLAYIGKRRLYLEHLVVALYSHAFLLLALLTMFLLVGLDRMLASPGSATSTVVGWVEVAVWWSMPIYLLVMQKRVYGQGWTVTTLKYFVLGTAYLMLVLFASVVAGLAGLAKV